MLTSRFEEALVFATRLHASQVRKGTAIPYVAHLMSVASLVLEDGGDEDESIAALLHDSVEDQGGATILADIQARFGERVASIIADCSDTVLTPKPPWRARKEVYVAHLRTAPTSSLRVCAADKLHNARAILADLRSIGPSLWQRFASGEEGTLWYYRAVADVLAERAPGPLTDELNRVVADIERLAVVDRGSAPGLGRES